MSRTTNHLLPELRFALYKEAMRVIEKQMGKKCWTEGWPLIRGLGKKLAKNDDLDDAECADAVILYYKSPKWLPKQSPKTNFLTPSDELEPPWDVE